MKLSVELIARTGKLDSSLVGQTRVKLLMELPVGKKRLVLEPAQRSRVGSQRCAARPNDTYIPAYIQACSILCVKSRPKDPGYREPRSDKGEQTCHSL